jgi:hypothetical protein
MQKARRIALITVVAVAGVIAARSHGLRDRLARVHGAAVGAHGPGRQRHELHAQEPVEENVQVGVRAVDRDGYRSPVARPVPSS